MSYVPLLDGPMASAQTLDRDDVVDWDLERLLAQFRQEAGLPCGQTPSALATL